MKKAGYVLLPALLALLFATGQGVFAQKDSAAAPVQTKKAAVNDISDEELILDEPAGAIVPAAKKPVPAAPAIPAPAQPPAVVKPDVKTNTNDAPEN